MCAYGNIPLHYTNDVIHWVCSFSVDPSSGGRGRNCDQEILKMDRSNLFVGMDTRDKFRATGDSHQVYVSVNTVLMSIFWDNLYTPKNEICFNTTFMIIVENYLIVIKPSEITQRVSFNHSNSLVWDRSTIHMLDGVWIFYLIKLISYFGGNNKPFGGELICNNVEYITTTGMYWTKMISMFQVSVWQADRSVWRTDQSVCGRRTDCDTSVVGGQTMVQSIVIKVHVVQ